MVLNFNKKAMCSTKKPLSHRNSKFKIVIVGFPFKEFSFINIGIKNFQIEKQQLQNLAMIL